MSKLTPLDLYKHLPKTNCKACGLRSCMAFAVALIGAGNRLDACPHLSEETKDALSPLLEQITPKEGFREAINALRADVAKIDLAPLAERLGGTFENGKLHFICLGKDFAVSENGQVESVCHVNVWVELMLLNYIAMQGGHGLTGRWVAYAGLKNARPTAPYFEKRCEEPLRAIADAHADVFMDLIEIFGGLTVTGFDCDHAFILHPLPKVPFLILYTRAEGSLESKLMILLDSSITSYLPKEMITGIGRGIVEMFKKIVSRHQRVTDKLMFM